MASFYTEEKITINSLADIINRPKYQDSIRPLKHLFRYVLSAYSFPRKIACCGVSNCYQNHKKGYLVRTKDDGDCCVCESCAKKFFDASALKPPRATRSRTSSTPRSTTTRAASTPSSTVQIEIETYIGESARIKERIKQLKQMPNGANWLYQSISQFQKAYPQELISALKELQRKGEESDVFNTLIENNASDQQLQDLEQLVGLSIFTQDIRKVLIEDILKPLNLLDEKAKKSGELSTIAIPIDWSNQVKKNLETAEQLIAEAQLFFKEDNMKRLSSIPIEEKASRTLRNLRWDYDKGALK